MARSWSPLLMALERAKKISKYTQESHQMRIWIRIRIRIRMPEFGTWIWAMVCGVWGLGAAESPCQLFAFCHGKLDSWKRSLNCTWTAFRGGRFCIFAFLHLRSTEALMHNLPLHFLLDWPKPFGCRWHRNPPQRSEHFQSKGTAKLLPIVMI